MPTQRFNTSRRQVLRSYTEHTFYPQMFAKNIPYSARDRAYGASTAEQLGQLIGTVGSSVVAELTRLEAAKAQAAAEIEQKKEETRRAEALAKATETAKSVVPWLVVGVVAVVVVPKIFKMRSA
jgi:predicted DNA repair protein MutK